MGAQLRRTRFARWVSSMKMDVPLQTVSALDETVQRPITLVTLPRLAVDRIPKPLSSLIGREKDVARVVALLMQPDVRLLTLVGSGGIGKTRLALAVAEVLDSENREVIVVSLATLPDPSRLIVPIAQMCGLPEVVGKDAGAALAAAVGMRDLVLVLDNMEHLASGSGRLVELLHACPEREAVGYESRAVGGFGRATLPGGSACMRSRCGRRRAASGGSALSGKGRGGGSWNRVVGCGAGCCQPIVHIVGRRTIVDRVGGVAGTTFSSHSTRHAGRSHGRMAGGWGHRCAATATVNSLGHRLELRVALRTGPGSVSSHGCIRGIVFLCPGDLTPGGG